MMRRNYNDRYDSGMGFFGAFVMGAILGAIGVFFSDDRNRRRARATMDDWKNKAEDLKEQGLERVSEELDKTQKKVEKQRRNG